MLYKDLSGKAAVITGDYAIAKRFVQEQMNVVINYNSDQAGATEVVKQIEAAGGKGVAVQEPGFNANSQVDYHLLFTVRQY